MPVARNLVGKLIFIVASVLVSGGFFAVAHRRSLRIILYSGAVLLAATTLTVGVGLICSR